MEKVLRVLVVEDSIDDALLVIHQLKKGGYNIDYERVDTFEKMKVALEKKWDIVLSDYRMPHFSGFDALKLIQQTDLDIPFIIISGTIGEETAVEAMKAGAHDYIMKNNLYRLIPAIEREIRESKIRAERRILEIKQIQAEAIKESQENLIKLTTAVEQSPVSIVVTDKKGIIEYANPHFTYNTGYKNEEIIGRNPNIFKSGLTSSEVYKKLWETISTGNIWRGELCNKKKNGDLYWESVSISPVKNCNGDITHYIGIKEDITQRKQAIEALHESEERYRRLVEMSPDAIAVHQHGKIVFINSAGAKLFGAQKSQELIGTSVINLVHPDYREIVIQRIGKTLIGENAPYTEEKFIKLDGTLLDVEVTAIPSVFQGKPATQVVVRDISERKIAEAEIKLKNEELLKLNAEKDKFFSIIAHDLRSPFIGFLGLTEVLAENLNTLSAEKIRMYALGIRDSAAGIYGLLENLLEWAKIQRGLIPFEPRLFQLLPAIEECLATLQETAQKKRIEITTDIPYELEVLADNNMLKSVIRNLVSNAIKFTPQDGQISLSARTFNSKSIEIAIKDTGIGMNKKMVNNLFKLDAKTNRPGTDEEPSSGLGLLLCKEFIEKQRGKIWVESEEGNGSTFFFIIPYK